jgi:peroxiredoxin
MMQSNIIQWQSIPEMQVRIDGHDDFVLSREIFRNKFSLLFSVVCPFKEECTQQLLEYERYCEENLFPNQISDVYCISTSDHHVMKKWFEINNINHVKFIADGNAGFTTALLKKTYHVYEGLGLRTRKYSGVIMDNMIEYMIGPFDNVDQMKIFDYSKVTPEEILKYFSTNRAEE